MDLKERIMLTAIYLVSVTLLVFGIIFYTGWTGEMDVLAYIPMALIWPITLAGVVIATPFYGTYRLGKYVRRFFK
jgi:hypothetical protein